MKNVTKPIWAFLDTLIREGFEKFGRYYSKYRGFVSDNEDPDGFGRLKLVIPQITGKLPLDVWAWPVGNYSGKGYGSQVIPQKGDMVWVEFEMGNPRAPLWDFGHFSFLPDEKTPEKPEELKDIQNYWFMTPEGHRIEMDDKNKKVILTLLEKFLIGDKDAAENAVLGKKLKKLLEDLLDQVKAMNDKIVLITVPTSVGPSGTPVNAADFTAITQQITSIKNSIDDVLSTKVFLKD